MKRNVYETLSAININKNVEKKNGFSYLSWAWAWGELLKAYPESTYCIYESHDMNCYHNDGKTAWVKTGVTVEGVELIEFLPVMNFRNQSISVDAITSMDVNKAIQRSLTKAVARHGLGLYLYAGEDLPEAEEKPKEPLKETPVKEVKKATAKTTELVKLKKLCKDSGLKFADVGRWALAEKKKDIDMEAHARALIANWDKLTPQINEWLINNTEETK